MFRRRYYYAALRRERHRVQQCRHGHVRGQHGISSNHQDPGNSNGNAGPASIFITGINAPDGIAIDRDDNLWVCANQEDEIVVIDKTGKVIAKLGDFRGIDPSGFPRGLLFPASLAFSNDRSTLYVSNLTLFLPHAGAQAAINSAWTLEVKGSTVAKLHAKIPPFPDDNEQ